MSDVKSMNETHLVNESSAEMMLNTNGSIVHVYVMIRASEQDGGGIVECSNMSLLASEKTECSKSHSSAPMT